MLDEDAVVREVREAKRDREFTGGWVTLLYFNALLLLSQIALKARGEYSEERLSNVLYSLLNGIALAHTSREVQALDHETPVDLVSRDLQADLDLGVNRLLGRIPAGIAPRTAGNGLSDCLEEFC